MWTKGKKITPKSKQYRVKYSVRLKVRGKNIISFNCAS